MSLPRLWPDYRRATLALGILLLLAIALHRTWMPGVAYDPFAPFQVVHTTLSATWFPVAALAAWLAGKGRRIACEASAAVHATGAVPRLLACFVLAMLVGDCMQWHGVVNLTALALWLLLMLQRTADDAQPRSAAVVEILFAAALFAGASYVFTIVKAGLFHFHAPQDSALVLLERALFGAPDLYSRVAADGLGSKAAAFLESVYFQFFAHMLLVSVFLAARGDVGERRRYVVSLIVCYLLGGFSYYALPALGPAFFDPQRFEFLRDSARTTWDIQQVLLANTRAAQADFGGLRQLDVYGFIASMPSLHLAHESIMLYYSRHSPLAFAASGAFFLATCVAVVALGWHYLSDIPVGIGLAGAIIVLIRRSTTGVPRPAHQAASPGAAPRS